MFKLATFNANSIRARLDQIVSWLAENQPDVLCVQETKVQDQDFPLDAFADSGYHVTFKGQKSHAGVATFTKAEPQDVAFGLDDGGEPDEPRLIRLRVGDIWILNTYVPQGRDIEHEMFEYKLEWFKRLRSYMERHFEPSDKLIWTGDINVAPHPIDIYDPKALAEHVDFHPRVREALQETLSWGLVDVYRQQYPDEPGHYSYWDYRARNPIDRGVGWRIDLILATDPMAKACTKAWIDKDARHAERPSDHTFVVAEFDI